MKALSIKQPWAWLIVNGHKCIENRRWRSQHFGELAIHVSRSRSLLVVADLPEFQNLIPTMPTAAEFAKREDWGCVIGVVHVVDYFRPETPPPLVDWPMISPDPFVEGPWCWLLDRPRGIPPFPVTGHLRFFDVTIPG